MTTISTKKGDQGISGLASGARLDKDELIFEVLGSLDELNSWLGLIVAYFRSSNEKKFKTDIDLLVYLQNKLFVIGGVLAGSTKVKVSKIILNKIENRAAVLEKLLKDDWHNQFVLPGGTKQAARIDVARTVCRRLERRTVALSKNQQLNPLILKILNRLSDYLYLLRCWENKVSGKFEDLFRLKK